MISGNLDEEFTYEIRLVSGTEGRQLSLAQARALREVLEWVAARSRQDRRAA